MTQEEKQLLLKDLCMRIPYRTFVCLNPGAYNKPETCILTGVHGEKIHLNVDSDPFRINNIRPYLRPMSSMTDEEADYLQSIHDIISNENYGDGFSPSAWNAITEWEDYCNARYLDYRWLIAKGLALEAPEDMYKTE